MIDPGTEVHVRPTADPTAWVLSIHGGVTAGSEKALTRGWDKAADKDARIIVLDFSDIDYMNSGGIGLIVMLLVRAQRLEVRLQAIGLSDHYREIFTLTRLDQVVEIRDGLDPSMVATETAVR